jgi:hypothetical protein
VAKDVPPFVKAAGNPVKLYGLNSVGLQRSGFAEATVAELKRAYRLLFRSDLNLSHALERARAEVDVSLPEVAAMIAFVERASAGSGSDGVGAPRVGVVGAGGLGYHHVRILRDVAGAALAGFYEQDPARRAQVAGSSACARSRRSTRCSTPPTRSRSSCRRRRTSTSRGPRSARGSTC